MNKREKEILQGQLDSEKKVLKKLEQQYKQALAEINDKNGTDYQMSQVYFEFDHEVMSNAQENAQIELTQAQKQQVVINTLLSLADKLDNDTIVQNICDVLEIDYNEIKDKLPDPDESMNNIIDAGGELGGIAPVGGGVVE